MATDCSKLSDEELLRSIKALVADERRHLIAVLKRIREIDRRDLARRNGFQSLFDYCLRELRYSEAEAARRIHVARAAARFPILYRMLREGRLTLAAASLLVPHLKPDNYREILKRAQGLSTRRVEALAASLAPGRPPVERIRYVGALSPSRGGLPSTAGGDCAQEALFAPAAAPAPSAVNPSAGRLIPEPPSGTPMPPRVHFSFTADEKMLRDLERAKELLWHRFPIAKLEDVFGEALKVLLDRLDPERREASVLRPPTARLDQPAETPVAGASRRYVARWIKDEVRSRDGGSCAFVGAGGRRCGSRAGLEFDHVRPRALGGRSDDPANIRLLCRAHNQFEARRVLGAAAIEAALRARRRAR